MSRYPCFPLVADSITDPSTLIEDLYHKGHHTLYIGRIRANWQQLCVQLTTVSITKPLVRGYRCFIRIQIPGPVITNPFYQRTFWWTAPACPIPFYQTRLFLWQGQRFVQNFKPDWNIRSISNFIRKTASLDFTMMPVVCRSEDWMHGFFHKNSEYLFPKVYGAGHLIFNYSMPHQESNMETLF